MCVSPNAALFTRSVDFPRKQWDVSFVKGVYQDEIEDTLNRMVDNSLRNGVPAKWSMISCGQCFECRLQRSRVWANRCVMEASQYPEEDGVNKNWFVTLTYNPDSVDDLWNDEKSGLSLHQPDDGKKDHLQTFNNSIRQKWNRKFDHSGIRFYASGEYGDTKMRPHYHEILFNFPIDPSQLKYLFTSDLGHSFYICDDLSDTWQKGHVIVGEANWNTMAYTARYIMKKQLGDGSKMYNELGIKPPFTRMSRMPGIGFNGYKGLETYFNLDTESGELALHDTIYLPSDGKRPGSCRPPRYFDNIFKDEHPEYYDLVKRYREQTANIQRIVDKATVPISDRLLFNAKIDAFGKRPKGIYRDFLKNLD